MSGLPWLITMAGPIVVFVLYGLTGLWALFALCPHWAPCAHYIFATFELTGLPRPFEIIELCALHGLH